MSPRKIQMICVAGTASLSFAKSRMVANGRMPGAEDRDGLAGIAFSLVPEDVGHAVGDAFGILAPRRWLACR